MSELRELDKTPDGTTSFDLICQDDDKVVLELSRDKAGEWTFWGVRLPDGSRFGRGAALDHAAAQWLEDR